MGLLTIDGYVVSSIVHAIMSSFTCALPIQLQYVYYLWSNIKCDVVSANSTGFWLLRFHAKVNQTVIWKFMVRFRCMRQLQKSMCGLS